MDSRNYPSAEHETGTYSDKERKVLSLAYLSALKKTYILLENHKVYEVD
jgi:hypothetical protein